MPADNPQDFARQRLIDLFGLAAQLRSRGHFSPQQVTGGEVQKTLAGG